MVLKKWFFHKDTNRGNIPSSKTLPLTKIMNMDICVTGTFNQLLRTGSYTQSNLKSKKI